ncbi:hypothetical protein [Streptomonospora wellingtoniae]|uniref:Helix-turn-helix domain-containing protein n=1 Tax=Streptomonospora wellingtoniae TaxID=3075544 RepID=A0ABU2L0F9_9ACTN|nr:hypothetical protein [Streptomonospora sp. DSM 45055]MDT0305039.1 hypothetical protein [Streptomonospora sp. DSM 45055]
MEPSNGPPTPEQARAELREWARMNRDRDRRVRQAIAAGLQKKEIHEITGIGRPTIDRILATKK